MNPTTVFSSTLPPDRIVDPFVPQECETQGFQRDIVDINSDSGGHMDIDDVVRYPLLFYKANDQ